MQSPRIVYDDDDLRVVWAPGTSDFVLVTFGDLLTWPDGVRFFADKLAAQAGISCLGIVARRPHWYPRHSIEAAAEAILPLICGFANRVLYGSSMGGHAAIKFSALLGATQVMALCPQWSIDAAEWDGEDPGWQEHFRPAMARMGIRAEDMAGEIFMFVDAMDRRDRQHAGRISDRYAAAGLINVPMAGHGVTVILAGTDAMGAMIQACREGRKDALRRLIRLRRKDHPARQGLLIRLAIKRHPRQMFLAMLSIRDPDPSILRLGGLYLPFAKSVLEKHSSEAAEAYDDIYNRVLLAPELQHSIERQTGMITVFRTALAVDKASGMVVHTTDRIHHRLRLEVAGRWVRLFVDLAGVRVDIATDEKGCLTASPSAPENPCRSLFQLTPLPGRLFALSQEGIYVSMEPGGRVICDRRVAQMWEMLHLEETKKASTEHKDL